MNIVIAVLYSLAFESFVIKSKDVFFLAFILGNFGIATASTILAAIIAAAAAMSIYVKRSMNAKLKRTALGLNAVFSDINNAGFSGFPPSSPPPLPVEPPPVPGELPPGSPGCRNDALLEQGKQLTDEGMGKIQQGQDLLDSANKLKAEGQGLIQQGQDMLDNGGDPVEANALIEQGNAKIGEAEGLETEANNLLIEGKGLIERGTGLTKQGSCM